MSFSWQLAVGIFFLALVLTVITIAVMEFRGIRKTPGGLKVWVNDVQTTNYRTVRGIWLTEGVVVAVTLMVIAHGIWPLVIKELQVEAVYALFAMCGTIQGLNVGAFIGKRATADPAVIAAETNARLNVPTDVSQTDDKKKTIVRTAEMPAIGLVNESIAPPLGQSLTPALANAYPTERDD